MKAVVWTPPAVADMRRLDVQTARRIREAVDRYARTGQGDVVHLQGLPEFRLRIGDWRVRFMLERTTLQVLYVRKRSEAYR